MKRDIETGTNCARRQQYTRASERYQAREVHQPSFVSCCDSIHDYFYRRGDRTTTG